MGGLTRRSVAFVALLAACGDSGNGDTSATAEGSGTTTATETSTTMTSTSTTTTSSGEESSTTATPTGSETGTGTGTETTGETTGGPVMVPDPCARQMFNMEDIEPNDSPEDAADACTVPDFGYWGNFPTGGFLGPGDEVDYFVFQTPDVMNDVTIPVSPCWTQALDLLDVFIYEVQGGIVQQPPVYESATPDQACEGGQVTLAPATVFLLEIRGVDAPPMAVNYFW